MAKGRRINDLAAKIDLRTHSLIAGEPKDVGGADEGPSPTELLEASLVGCTIMTLVMYATRKGWDLRDVEVDVRAKSEGKETKMTREIALHGDLSQEQRERLLDIANKCPLHKILSNPISITTSLKPA